MQEMEKIASQEDDKVNSDVRADPTKVKNQAV